MEFRLLRFDHWGFDQMLGFDQMHTCQLLRFRRSHYGFPEKLETTAVVRNDYGFTLGWGCTFLVTI